MQLSEMRRAHIRPFVGPFMRATPSIAHRVAWQELLSWNCDEITMYPGDVLYLPLGAVHWAVATQGEPSFHLTAEMLYAASAPAST
jgi:ribosomal protein L16 Arg81 hydroxylase